MMELDGSSTHNIKQLRNIASCESSKRTFGKFAVGSRGILVERSI
jgi:hypothetical protein